MSPDTLVFRPTINPTRPAAPPQADGTPATNDADVYINPTDFQAIFAADRSPAQAAVMAAEQRPVSGSAYNGGIRPRGDVAQLGSGQPGRQGDPTPQRRNHMAQQAGACVTAIHSAHDSLTTHPAVVDQLILNAANSINAAYGSQRPCR